jgi:cephalosporin hydroxylase
MADPIVDQFHLLYYRNYAKTWMNTRWLGTLTYKCPLDMWIYQELLHEIRPGLIIETGTLNGGSALFFATICDVLGTGQVVSIDIEHSDAWPKHDRLTYLQGSSTDPAIVATVQQLLTKLGDVPVLVCLDSNHGMPHVSAELAAYAPLVTVGSYVIVEDTNCNANPVPSDWGPGPIDAVRAFLAGNPDFVCDAEREKFMMTFNPGSYLRRVS